MGFCMLLCSEDCTSYCPRPCRARSSQVAKHAKHLTPLQDMCVTKWLGSKSARLITYKTAAPIVIRILQCRHEQSDALSKIQAHVGL